jgi:2,3-bisphosphoglycerate-independent phosphoglycerate mutase
VESKIKNCVILAAGLGVRLKPLTDEEPKCLTEIGGKTILEQTLEVLEKNGIQETVIVVGYLGDVVIKKIGNKYKSMKITYIWNRIYEKTNSMYSAWLAREYLKRGAILIEGDTIFEEALIKELLGKPEVNAYWAESIFTEEYNGSMATADKENRIRNVEIVRGRLKEYKNNFFKSTGVLKITPEYGRAFSGWLDDDVKKGNVTIYYDLVIAKHLEDFPIYVCDVTKKARWAEIDNFDDLKAAENIFKPSRYVVILMEGALYLPIKELGNKTPLESAKKPNIDFIAKMGKTGIIQTNFQGLPVCGVAANLGILGYNPLRYYPNGRASFEALAQDIYLDDDDIVFRCDLVSLERGNLKDFTSANIIDEEAGKIIENLKFSDSRIKIYRGKGYRNLLILKDAKIKANEILASEPDISTGKKIDRLLLKGTGDESRKVAGLLNDIMLDSIEKIKDLNKKFSTAADMIFLWSPSSVPRLFSFHKKFGIGGAVVPGLDFTRGIAVAAGMAVKKTREAACYSNTDLKEKLEDAKNHLMHNELLYIHINAKDKEPHNSDVKSRVKIIEKIDNEIVGPVLEFLNEKFEGRYRIAVLSDYYTLLENGKHLGKPVPYALYGKNIGKDGVLGFSEKEIESANKNVIKSYEFLDFVISQDSSV